MHTDARVHPHDAREPCRIKTRPIRSPSRRSRGTYSETDPPMRQYTFSALSRAARSFAGVLALALSFLAAPLHAGNVAILAADSAANTADAQAKLTATGFFGQVDVINAGTTTPTLAQLQAYSAVLVWSNVNFLSTTALG